jgi:hypothetical protein
MPTLHQKSFDANRYFDLSIDAAEEWAKRNPTPPVIERTIETDRPIAVVFTSDWHIGNPGTAHRLLREDMLTIADHPRLYAELGGDWADNYVIPKLMHAGIVNVFAAGDQQMVITLLICKPLFDKRKVISVRRGNHNGWTMAVSMIDPLFATFGEVPELCSKDGSILLLHVGSQTYRIFRRHRPRWHSVFNNSHCVTTEYQRGPFEFDVGVIEHQHMSHYALFDGKERDDGSTDRIALRTGTYKVSDAHAEEFGYYYSSSEQVSIIFWPDKFQMQPVKGLGQTVELIDAL